jgi:hypothetical protein
LGEDIMTLPPTYTKEELEARINHLNKVILEIIQSMEMAQKHLYNLEKRIAKELPLSESFEYSHKIYMESMRIQEIVNDALDTLIDKTLYPDPDVEKYEKQYNVDLNCGDERVYGVVLLRENDRVKPVVIWRNYSIVNYWRGVPRAGNNQQH